MPRAHAPDRGGGGVDGKVDGDGWGWGWCAAGDGPALVPVHTKGRFGWHQIRAGQLTSARTTPPWVVVQFDSALYTPHAWPCSPTTPAQHHEWRCCSSIPPACLRILAPFVTHGWRAIRLSWRVCTYNAPTMELFPTLGKCLHTQCTPVARIIRGDTPTTLSQVAH